MQNKIKKIVFFLSLFFPLLLIAQNEEKEAGEIKERIAKQTEKAEEKGRKRHLSIQQKQTRKRMKKHAQQSRRLNENKKEFFWERWARKRRK